MTALIDASSAILLYKCGMWNQFAAGFNYLSGPEVFREITLPGRSGSETFENGFTEKIIPPDRQKADVCLKKYPSVEKLGDGEKELILLYYQNAGHYIILDDRNGVTFCRNEGIPHINALLVPHILYFNGKISEIRKDEFTVALVKTGRYSSFVKTFAEQCTREDLIFFLD